MGAIHDIVTNHPRSATTRLLGSAGLRKGIPSDVHAHVRGFRPHVDPHLPRELTPRSLADWSEARKKNHTQNNLHPPLTPTYGGDQLPFAPLSSGVLRPPLEEKREGW